MARSTSGPQAAATAVAAIVDALRRGDISRAEAEARLEALRRPPAAPVVGSLVQPPAAPQPLPVMAGTAAIAVIGMACQAPGAETPEEYWEVLCGKRAVPASRRLRADDGFDPLFFRIAPREADHMSPHQRLVLQESWKALEDAAIRPSQLAGTQTAVFVGAEPAAGLGNSFTGASDAIIAARLSYLLNLRGPSLVVNTGCSSSASAIHLACEALRSGSATLALAGGVFANLSPGITSALTGIGMVSPSGRCLAFDAAADGTALCEGVGMVALKRLEDALAAGDPVHGVILASGANQDGASNGITAPNGLAQSELFTDLYRRHGIDPAKISYVEAHGTGTALGDPVEANALTRAFAAFTAERGFCRVGSAKAAIGHASAAAGVLGLIKLLLCMRHGHLPGMPHLTSLNPLIDLSQSALVIDAAAAAWPALPGAPRLAALSSFGHSGTNVHAVVAGPELASRAAQGRPPMQAQAFHAVPVSARTPGKLTEVLRQLQALAAAAGDGDATVELRDMLAGIIGVSGNAIDLHERLDDLGVQPEHRMRLAVEAKARWGVETPALTANSLQDIVAALPHAAAEPDLGSLALTLQHGRDAREERAVFVVRSMAELSSAVAAALAGGQRLSAIAPDAPAGLAESARQWLETGEARWPVPATTSRRIHVSLQAYVAGPAMEADPVAEVEVVAADAPPAPVPPSGPILLAPLWERAEAPLPQRLAGPLLVIAEAGDVRAAQILAALPAASVTPSGGVTLEALAAAERILWLSPLRRPRHPADDPPVLDLLTLMHRLLAAGAGDMRLDWTFVTAGGLATHSAEPADPHQAALHGFIGVLAKEVTAWSCRAADLPQGHAMGAETLGRLLGLPLDARARPWAGRSVDGPGGSLQWLRQKFVPAIASAETPQAYRQGGVYIVIGGAGDIGRVWSAHAAAVAGVQSIWVGRRAEDEAIRAAIRTVASAGPAPVYFAADATDAAQLARVRDAVKARFGAVNGVIHSALDFFEQDIAGLDDERFLRGFLAKAASVEALAEAFAGEELDTVVMFSSVVAQIRNPRQAAYAAGCAFKDALAHEMNRQWRCPVKTINWGYWSSSKEQAADESALKAFLRLAGIGIGLIEPAEGMQALDALLTGPLQQMGLVKTTRPIEIEGVDATTRLLLPVTQGGAAIPGAAMPEAALPDIDVVALKSRAEIAGLDACLMDLLAAQLDTAGVFGADPPQPAGTLGLWLAESLRLLAQSGRIALQDGTWRRAGATAVADAWAPWAALRAAFAGDAARLAQLDLVEAALRALPGVLRGRQSATDALFPKGSMALVENVHRHNPVADTFHHAMAELAAAALRRKRAAGGSPMRILEIGAGTGGTTAHVLAALRQAGESDVGCYAYTDLSQAFLHHGAEAFGADRPFMRFALLDIERAPEAQGFDLGCFDLVVAGNVLHATRDIRRTLRHAKALLRPGGLLLACEVSQNALFTHLTFGLLEGWWLAEDPEIRIPGCPGLTPEGWRDALAREGFTPTTFPAQRLHALGQQVILAVSDGTIRRAADAPAMAAAAEPMTFDAGSLVHAMPHTEDQTAPATLARADAIAYFRAAAARALRMAPAEIDENAALDRYGMDSILAVGLADELNQHFKGVSSTLVFEHRTVADIATHFMATQAEALARVAARPAHGSAPAPAAERPVIAAERPVIAAAAPPSASPRPQPPLPKLTQRGDDRIAVIGMSGRFPGADSIDALWSLITQGRSAIGDMPAERWSEEQMKLFQGEAASFHSRGGYVAGIDRFDPQFFGIAKAEARWIDPRQRLFLEEAWHAFEDAGIMGRGLRGSDCGVFVGVEEGEYGFLTKGRGQIGSNQIATLAARIAYSLDLRGPNFALSAACSSGLLAVHQACQALRAGECGLALAGGVSLILSPVVHLGLAHGKMLSTDGACRVFDAKASGMVPADGVAALVLKRMDDAIRDGDAIHGVIRASAVNYNGRTLGMAAPNPRSQAALIESLYEKAGIAPRDIQLILAHSAGSALTDAVEVEALTQAFTGLSNGQAGGAGQCVVSSIKPLIGHSFAASGVVNLIAMIRAMQAATMPGTQGLDALHPRIGNGQPPFTFATQNLPWARPVGGLRRGAVGASGLSGTNVHVVVEEYAGPDAADSHRGGPQLFVLSAATQEALGHVLDDLRAALSQLTGAGLAAIARTLQLGRAGLGCRAAFTASDLAELDRRLGLAAAALHGPPEDAPDWLILGAPGRAPGPIAGLVGGDAGKAFIHALTAEAAPGGAAAEAALGRIGALWAQGVDIPWTELYGSTLPEALRLPGYPFARERYWIPDEAAPAVTPAPAAAEATPAAPPLSEPPEGGAGLADRIRHFLAQHLGIEAGDIADHADRHDYGVDSILETRLMTMLEEQAGMTLSGRELAAHPTVGGLARHLDARNTKDAERAWPLSEGQKGLWMLHRLDPGSSAYHVPLAFSLREDWSRETFRGALNALCVRFPVLLCALTETGGEAAMRALPAGTLDFAVLPAAQDMESLRAAMAACQREPFSLANGPLFRVRIWPGPDGHDAVLIVFHHLIIDGLSVVAFLEALWLAYGALKQGRPIVWPDAPADYAEFVSWERAMLDGPDGAGHRAFWKARLSGLSAAPGLAGDKPPAAAPGAGRTVGMTLPATISDGLRRLARAHGLRESALYLALWQAVIARLARSEDPVIGLTAQTRPQGRFEKSIGYFVNTLPLRCPADPGALFLDHALAMQNAMQDALDHAAYPFPVMVRECLEAGARDGAARLLASTFSYQNLVPRHLRDAAAGGHVPAVAAFADVSQEGEDGLALEVTMDGAAAAINLKYTDDQWAEETVSAIARGYCGMAEKLIAQPGSRWSAVAPPPAPARWQMGPAAEGMDGAVDVLAAIAASCRATPHAIAVEMADAPDERLTFAELAARSAALARALRRQGVGPGSYVAVCMRRQPLCIAALLAVFECGAAYVPISPDDPGERLRAILGQAGVRHVIACAETARDIPTLAEDGRKLVMCRDAETGGGAARPARPVHSPDAVAYILFTSGSTGTPKGVIVSRRAVSAHAAKMVRFLGSGPDDRVLQFTPLTLDPSLEQILAGLSAGARIVMRGEELWTGQAFWEVIRTRNITVADTTPSYLREALAAAPAVAPPGLRLMLVGGESFPINLFTLWRTSKLGTVTLINAYGPTETTVTSAALPAPADMALPEGLRSVPVGRPLAGEAMLILDAYGQPAAEGFPGEIYIGGAGVAQGYLAQAALSAERFVSLPEDVLPASGMPTWFRTGDLARYIPGTDGLIECLGRIDRQVKVRGVRIELDDVLAAVLSGPAVLRAGVRVESDAGGQAILVAEVAFEAGAEPAAALRGLRAHLERLLPAAMIPARVSAAGAEGATHASERPAQPDASLAGQVGALWGGLLGVADADPEGNFFHLGGHSLLALRLLHLVEQRFGVSLPLSAFLKQPTLAGVCRMIADVTTAAPAAFFIAPEDAALDVLEALRNCADWPFQNLSAQTGDATQTVEDMARQLVLRILSESPAGPYRLAGWSFGGILAFEAAAQLVRLGHGVSELVLIESYAPGAIHTGGAAPGAGFGRSLFAALGAGWPEGIDDGDLAGVLTGARAAGLVHSAAEEALIERSQRIFVRQTQALSSYRPGVYAGDVTLVRARAELARCLDAGWRELVAGRLQVLTGEGDHQSILRPPCLAEVARLLSGPERAGG